VVTVVNALSGDAILQAHCRSQFRMKGNALGPMLHCLKYCIQEESGINMLEFSLLLPDDSLVSDRMNLCCPPMTMLGRQSRKLTLKMVRHKVDVRHLTARNFPDEWLEFSWSTFMSSALEIFSMYGEIVEIDDVSKQWVRDDDREGERTIEVHYLQKESAIAAVAAMNAYSLANFAQSPHDRFVCVVKGSPVSFEKCNCVNRKCTAFWKLGWITMLKR